MPRVCLQDLIKQILNINLNSDQLAVLNYHLNGPYCKAVPTSTVIYGQHPARLIIDDEDLSLTLEQPDIHAF